MSWAKLRFTVGKQGGSKNLVTQAHTYGFEVIPISGDGNCFFSAVAHQLQQLPEDHRLSTLANHKVLLQRAVHYVLIHLDEFKEYIEGSLDVFIENISRDYAWADHVIIVALSKTLNVNIVVCRSDQEDPAIIKQAEADTTLYLAYEVGVHYNSLHRNSVIEAKKDFDVLL